MTILHLSIPSMACSACVETITKAVQEIDAGATVEANLKTKQVQITTCQSDVVVKSAISNAGYPVM